MASRKEEKERLRREREERERRERASAERRQRLVRLGGAGAVLAVAAVAVALVALGGGDGGGGSQAAQKGLQTTPGPWSPKIDGLEEREEALDLPAPSDTIYHVHAQLAVFVNGKRFTVPNNIGIAPDQQFLSSLHTHDDKGIVHMEAVERYPFTLGQFFTVWGVKFTNTQLGGYRVGNGLVLETYVNGKKVPNGPAVRMKQSDRVVVGFGKPGSFQKDFKLDPAAAG